MSDRGVKTLNDIKDEFIYQAKDRGFPLNEMRQDIVDKWLNERIEYSDGLSYRALLFYEVDAIARAQKEKADNICNGITKAIETKRRKHD